MDDEMELRKLSEGIAARLEARLNDPSDTFLTDTMKQLVDCKIVIDTKLDGITAANQPNTAVRPSVFIKEHVATPYREDSAEETSHETVEFLENSGYDLSSKKNKGVAKISEDTFNEKPKSSIKIADEEDVNQSHGHDDASIQGNSVTEEADSSKPLVAISKPWSMKNVRGAVAKFRGGYTHRPYRTRCIVVITPMDDLKKGDPGYIEGIRLGQLSDRENGYFLTVNYHVEFREAEIPEQSFENEGKDESKQSPEGKYQVWPAYIIFEFTLNYGCGRRLDDKVDVEPIQTWIIAIPRTPFPAGFL